MNCLHSNSYSETVDIISFLWVYTCTTNSGIYISEIIYMQ